MRPVDAATFEAPLLEAYERIVFLGGTAPHAARVATMRAQFEQRCGRFAPENAWFEARSAAFWDDALTRQRFARTVEAELPAPARDWIAPLGRAHRGLFRRAGADVVHDLWSGADFVVETIDDGSRAALASAEGLFDARVVAADAGARGALVLLLPGALFHPEDASEPIAKVLAAARERGLRVDDALDALLRMERSLRSLSRVKPAYAYRPEALGK